MSTETGRIFRFTPRPHCGSAAAVLVLAAAALSGCGTLPPSRYSGLCSAHPITAKVDLYLDNVTAAADSIARSVPGSVVTARIQLRSDEHQDRCEQATGYAKLDGALPIPLESGVAEIGRWSMQRDSLLIDLDPRRQPNDLRIAIPLRSDGARWALDRNAGALMSGRAVVVIR